MGAGRGLGPRLGPRRRAQMQARRRQEVDEKRRYDGGAMPASVGAEGGGICRTTTAGLGGMTGGAEGAGGNGVPASIAAGDAELLAKRWFGLSAAEAEAAAEAADAKRICSPSVGIGEEELDPWAPGASKIGAGALRADKGIGGDSA